MKAGFHTKTYHAWKTVGQGRHQVLSRIISFEEKTKIYSRNAPSAVPTGFVVGLETVKNIHHKCLHSHFREIMFEHPPPSPAPHEQEQAVGLSSQATWSIAAHWGTSSSAAPPASPGSVSPPGTPAPPPP